MSSFVSIQVVDHPSLGQTRKALALVFRGKRIAYLHNDFDWYHEWESHLHCAKVFSGTSSAEKYFVTVRLSVPSQFRKLESK